MQHKVTPRRAAVVAVDVAGYSRLMGADEAGKLATLKAHQTQSDALADRFGGRTDHSGNRCPRGGAGVCIRKSTPASR